MCVRRVALLLLGFTLTHYFGLFFYHDDCLQHAFLYSNAWFLTLLSRCFGPILRVPTLWFCPLHACITFSCTTTTIHIVGWVLYRCYLPPLPSVFFCLISHYAYYFLLFYLFYYHRHYTPTHACTPPLQFMPPLCPARTSFTRLPHT